MFYTYKARWNPARPDFYPLEEIIIVGHRGAPVLAPGNTIESFKKAFETGIKGIELDIQLSKDKELVVFHDWNLKNITGSPEKIEAMDYIEILNISHKNNCKIPLLREVLEICPDGKFINIEIKSLHYSNIRLVEEVVKIIWQYKIEKFVVISSFNPFVLKFAKKIAPDLPTAYLWSSEEAPFLFNSPMWIWMCQPDGFHININNASQKIISWARKKNLTVLAFTVNNLSDFFKAQELGLDGIFTDNPHLKLSSESS